MAEHSPRQHWFYVSSGEVTEGPFEAAALRAQIAAGRIDGRFQLWDEETQAWAPFSRWENLLNREPDLSAPRTRPLRRPTAPKPLLANADGPRAPVEPIRTVVPRHHVYHRAAAEPSEPDPKETAGETPAAADPQMTPALAFPRRRNYSPITAGGNAPHPFAPGFKPEIDPPETVPARAQPPVFAPAAPEPGLPPPPPARPRVWPIAARCAGLCALALAALWLAGWVNFGPRASEENRRLTSELAATNEKLALKSAGLKKIMAEKEEYLARFAAAQLAVRNMRVYVFASARRALEMADRTGVDQRLFELDQLNNLMPETDAEKKIHHELTDAFFNSAPPPAATLLPAPAPSLAP